MNFLKITLIVASMLLVFGAVFVLSGEYKKAKLRNLNHFYPHEYTYLYSVEKGLDPVDKIRLEKYRVYYHKLIQYKPDLAEAHMMLGYCDFYLNDLDGAGLSFKKAVDLKIPLPAAYYNLGLVSYMKGDYVFAVKVLKAALEANLSQMSSFLIGSKVYLDIITSSSNIVEENQQRLVDQYRAIYRLLILCFYQLKDNEQMLLYFKQAVLQFNDPAAFEPLSTNKLLGARLF